MFSRILPSTLLLPSLILLMILGAAPLAGAGGFIANRGQVDPAVAYYSRGDGVDVYFTSHAIVFDLADTDVDRAKNGEDGRPQHPLQLAVHVTEPKPQRRHAVWIRGTGRSTLATPGARAELVTLRNYYLGNDPDRWVTDVPAFQEIVYRDAWPGVDLVFREEGRRLVCLVEAAPDADPSSVGFDYEGIDGLRADADGPRYIETSLGVLLEARDSPQRITWSFEASTAQVGRKPDSHTSAMRDDPAALLWSTYLGGSQSDDGSAVASGDDWFMVTGSTFSSNFPTTAGAYDGGHNGLDDVFLALFDTATGTLARCTYLGGSNADYARDVAIDTSDRVIVVGGTWSSNFPATVGAYDTSFNGGTVDGFAAKLARTCGTLLWSTFVGGNHEDWCESIALDESGNALIAGGTYGGSFPISTSPYDPTHNGDLDVFVSKLTADGATLPWSTYLGGAGEDRVSGIAHRGGGDPYVVGTTHSSNFPTTPGAHDGSLGGGSDAFVSLFAFSLSWLSWSTYLGGSALEDGWDVALLDDAPFVTGMTQSADFPTTAGAYDASIGGISDAFVTSLHPWGSSLLWSTFLGGSDADRGRAIAVDAIGDVVVTGQTYSDDFPTTPSGYDQSLDGDRDAFCAKLIGGGATLHFGTYLGGTAVEESYGVAPAGDDGNPIVTGETTSDDYPTTPGAYDRSHNGGFDVFISKLDVSGSTAVETMTEPVARGQNLASSRPNPFASATTIRYDSGAPGANIIIHDSTGRAVRTLVEMAGQDIAPRAVRWDGRDDRGRAVVSGVYYYRIVTGERALVGRVVLVR